MSLSMLKKINKCIAHSRLPTKSTKINAQKAPIKDLRAKKRKTWNQKTKSASSQHIVDTFH